MCALLWAGITKEAYISLVILLITHTFSKANVCRRCFLKMPNSPARPDSPFTANPLFSISALRFSALPIIYISIIGSPGPPPALMWGITFITFDWSG